MKHISREQEIKEYNEYVNTPDKLSLNVFRPKLSFNINRGLAEFDLRYLSNPDDYN